ncbi:MAG TPA: hypothetical protein VMM58_09120 [Bacteroidota bacterium]|nr:hypothetical protein [Bacteroidota bacterium]
MLDFIFWIIIAYILVKVFGVILQMARPYFNPQQRPKSPVREKRTKEQFNNIQDADFEDITDTKKPPHDGNA